MGPERSRAPFLLASLIACGLAGCSSVTPIATNVDTPGMPNAEVALQKSMDETSTELTRIGAMQPAAAVASKPASFGRRCKDGRLDTIAPATCTT